MNWSVTLWELWVGVGGLRGPAVRDDRRVITALLPTPLGPPPVIVAGMLFTFTFTGLSFPRAYGAALLRDLNGKSPAGVYHRHGFTPTRRLRQVLPARGLPPLTWGQHSCAQPHNDRCITVFLLQHGHAD